MKATLITISRIKSLIVVAHIDSPYLCYYVPLDLQWAACRCTV